LELKRTHQFLVYGDVNSWVKDIDSIKKNIELLLATSKEDGLEV